MDTTVQNVGILGGSFDPVHKGHIAIANSFLNSGFIDQLWILLTPEPPHKPDNNFASYDLRLEMLQKAFRDIEGVKVSDIEKNLPQPSYTIQTLTYISDRHPDKKLFLCIGEDSARDFKSWKNWEQIVDYCDLLVARRPNTDGFTLDSKLSPHTYYIDHEPVEISSTEVRKRVANEQDITDLVPEEIIEIIKSNDLYKNGKQ